MYDPPYVRQTRSSPRPPLTCCDLFANSNDVRVCVRMCTPAYITLHYIHLHEHVLNVHVLFRHVAVVLIFAGISISPFVSGLLVLKDYRSTLTSILDQHAPSSRPCCILCSVLFILFARLLVSPAFPLIVMSLLHRTLLFSPSAPGLCLLVLWRSFPFLLARPCRELFSSPPPKSSRWGV